MTKKEPVTLSSFTDFTEIGCGAFGTVYRAIYEKKKKAFAIKKISKKKIKEQKMEHQVMKEIKISYQLQHPHIIRLHEVINEDDYVYLVLELAGHGQLYARLVQQGRIDEQFARKVISQTVSALKYLHTRAEPIIHRDIKPENILLDANDDVKLADFGWSNYSNQKRTTYCGTNEYLAPEMVDTDNQDGHDSKLDIWCLGVLTYELLVGYPPFTPDTSKTKFNNERQKLFDNILNVRLTFPNDFPPLAKDFVMKILKRKPQQRATLVEIVQHPWLKSQPVGKIPKMQLNNAGKRSPKQQEQTYYKAIIQDLNKKNQLLQKQLHTLKIDQGLKKQQPVIIQKSNEADDKRFKTMEEISQKYKKEIQTLRSTLASKDREIAKMKSQLKSSSEVRQDCQQFKTQRNSLQEKYRSLRKMHEQLQQKYLDVTTTLENERLEFNNKIREVRKNKGGSSQQQSLGIIGDLQQAMAELSKRFSESKKLIAEISRKQNNLQSLENEVQKLRFQQNNIKEEAQAELKDYYDNKMDELMLSARGELAKERQKWMDERAKLLKMAESEPSTSYSNSIPSSNRDLEIDQELKKTRELNQFLQRRIKEQEYKIKDLEDASKRKK